MKQIGSGRNYSFVDIFAGCGGLSLGLMQAGWKGLFAVEHDKFAFETLHANLIDGHATYRFNWPSWLPIAPHSATDLISQRELELRELAGSVDLLVGGPPCQGFSSAGKRNPNDPRNKLVEAYLKYVQILQPKLVLIENVRGFTSDFDGIPGSDEKVNYSKWMLEKLGENYAVATKLIDTSDFGVPQKRQRFFVVARRKDIEVDFCPFSKLMAERLGFVRRKGINVLPVSSRMAISDLEIRKNGTTISCDTPGFQEICYKGPLTNYQHIMNLEARYGSLPDTRIARHKPEIRARFERIIELCHAEGRLNTSLSAEHKASFGLKKSAIRVLDPDRPSPTITSMPDDLIHYAEPRTLTVRENARLQSFPDWFAFHGKYTSGGDRRKREVPRFTQVANAVPPLVAEAIGETLIEMLEAATNFAGECQKLTDLQKTRGTQGGVLEALA